MAPYKEKPIIKRYFTISETCDIINEQIPAKTPDDAVVPSKLRYWGERCRFLDASVIARRPRKYTAQRIGDLVLFIGILNTGWYTVKGAIMEFKKVKRYQ